MIRLLLTGGGGAGAEALDRLWRGVYDVHVADADADALSPAIPIERRHRIPMAGPEWATAVAELCRRLSIDVLIPGVDEELPLVPGAIALAPGVVPLLPSASFVRLMKDKLESMEALASAGIDVPRTLTIDRASEIGFPCLVKPRGGRGSRGVQVLNGPAQVDAYRTLAQRPAEQLLAQELLVGQEWTVYVAADQNARLRSVVPARVDLKRGITLRAETVAHDGIVTYCRSIHDRFPVSGAFNVQLMESLDGRLAAFEINPRVSTTLCLAVAAGADPIADLFATECGGSLRPFVSGMRLRRNWFNWLEPRGQPQ